MDKVIEINENKYNLKTNYNDAFDEEDFKSKCTDYFKGYDYIVGDIAYSKLRLKGFNTKKNPNYNKMNDFDRLDAYIKNNCAFGCKYFVLEKIQK